MLTCQTWDSTGDSLFLLQVDESGSGQGQTWNVSLTSKGALSPCYKAFITRFYSSGDKQEADHASLSMQCSLKLSILLKT